MLFPNVFPASNDPSLSLTIYNASVPVHVAEVMTIVALIFTPIVLIYQAWTYWIFRKRMNADVIPSPDEGSLDYPEEAIRPSGMRPFDPRLLRYASATRGLSVLQWSPGSSPLA